MKHNKSSLFLMEMIICILFFSISAAVCVQFFVRSHTMSQSSIEENHAVIALESIAECFYVDYGDLNQIAANYYSGYSIVADNSLYIFYDEKFDLVSVDSSLSPDSVKCAYKAILSIDETLHDDLINASVVYIKSNDDSDQKTAPIFSLDLAVNNPNRISSK